MRILHCLLPLLAAGLLAGPAAGSVLPAAEIDARNAAAGYVLARVATLGMLRDECEPLLGAGDDGAAAVARGWWERNLPDIEAAYAWGDRYLALVRRASEVGHQRALRQLSADAATLVRNNALLLFGRERPDAASCRAALQPYAGSHGDLRQLAAEPGKEQLAGLLRSLAAVRAEPGYLPPARLRQDPDAYLHHALVASKEAAQAAIERGDAEGARAILEDMAGRGDAKAAQTLGGMYLEGGLLPRDEAQAYRWFHRAWMLRDPEGLNALGVMHRDGRGVPANPQLALALFHLARLQAQEPAARERVAQNLQRLGRRLTPAQRGAAACLTLRQIADAVERPLAAPGEAKPARDRFFIAPGYESRLGEAAPLAREGRPLAC